MESELKTATHIYNFFKDFGFQVMPVTVLLHQGHSADWHSYKLDILNPDAENMSAALNRYCKEFGYEFNTVQSNHPGASFELTPLPFEDPKTPEENIADYYKRSAEIKTNHDKWKEIQTNFKEHELVELITKLKYHINEIFSISGKLAKQINESNVHSGKAAETLSKEDWDKVFMIGDNEIDNKIFNEAAEDMEAKTIWKTLDPIKAENRQSE